MYLRDIVLKIHKLYNNGKFSNGIFDNSVEYKKIIFLVEIY